MNPPRSPWRALFIGSVVTGLAGTGLCVYKMLEQFSLGNAERMVHWQRMRCVGQAFTISVLCLNVIWPYLTSQLVFFRDVRSLLAFQHPPGQKDYPLPQVSTEGEK